MASRTPMMRQSTPFIGAPARRHISVPLYLAIALFYLLLVPEQANFRIAGALLSPYRLFLIPAFLYLLQNAIRGGFRFTWPDFAIAFGCAWIALASYISSDSIADAAIQGGAHALDIAFPYFVARFAINSLRDFRIFLICIAPGVGLTGSVMLIEAVTGRHLIQPLFASLTGNPNRIGVEYRLGLMRGSASFPHPILAGICLASFLPLYTMSGLRGWPKIVGLAGSFGAFFSLSSAALLGLLAGTMLPLFDRLVAGVSNLGWRIFLTASALVYVVVELTSASGFFNLLVRFASLNTVSAYNRVLIWRYGSENVIRNPWFGIGYDDWDRPDWMQWINSFSVDHFWLLTAMRFGLPVALLFILATGSAVFYLAARSSQHSPADARLMRGTAISLAVFALGAVSVALWLNAMVWYFILVGMAVSLAFNSPPSATRFNPQGMSRQPF
uniref:O-antigen ligase family protein n=1 Tax=uncultured Erythrobacter sp. TaxID=263913 RepID=UPI002609CC82|nr:O-antigen ligase family protein [uncultured Erythrobacter sp.]